MVLFVSDAHLGSAAHSTERQLEAALITCLRFYQSRITHLYLVGDIFEGFIEYRRLIPRGFVRLQALLADWTDHGIRVTYLVGNHDPWHRDYFSTELGVRVAQGALRETLFGVPCHIEHGDVLDGRKAGLRPLLRSRTMVWLYRTILPGDAGMMLARSTSKCLRRREPDPTLPEVQQDFARQTLRTCPVTCVIMGHSHQAAHYVWAEGIYMNIGSWRDGACFGTLEQGQVRLMRWDGAAPVTVAASDSIYAH